MGKRVESSATVVPLRRAPRIDPEPEDAQVARARAGDRDVWSRLYQEHFDEVFQHVCYLTADPLLSEDLVQETFARAFSAIRRFDGRSSFATWVRGIASNVVRMHLRGRQTARRGKGRMPPPLPVPTPATRHLQQAQLKALYHVLEKIPAHLREAFVLRDLQGLDPAEGASILAVSVGNFSVRASRARTLVRKELINLGWIESEVDR